MADTAGVSPAPPSPFLTQQEQPGEQAVKKTRKQVLNDFPPLAFDSPVEPDPSTRPSPSSADQKQPGRRQAVKKPAKRQKEMRAGLKQVLQKERDLWSGVPSEDLEGVQIPRRAKPANFLLVQKAAEEATAALERHDPEPLRRHRFVYGHLLLQEVTVQIALHRLLDRAFLTDLQKQQEKARATLIKVLERPIWRSRGAKEKLTEEERQRKKKENDLQVQHSHRALRYYDRMWDTYTDETAGERDISTLRRIACDIARKECARGKEAKQEGVRLFLKRVKAQLSA